MIRVMDFSIIIVNWNTRDLLKACLQSITENCSETSYEVVVVDNASSDGSNDLVKAQFSWVKLIHNQQNVGFSRANNQGILQSSGRYILLLNPDTVFLNDVLQEIRCIYDTHQDIGIIGGRLITPDNRPQRWSKGRMLSIRTAFNHYLFLSDLFPNLESCGGVADNSDYQHPADVDWVSGACLAVKRQVLDDVGLLDETIFMYSEDMDLCYRTKQAGYRVIYAPSAHIKHIMGQSLKQQTNRAVLSAPIKSQDMFYQRLYGQHRLLAFRTIVGLGSALRVIMSAVKFIFRRSNSNKYRFDEARRNFDTALNLWRESFDR